MVKRLIDEQGLQSTDEHLAELFRVAAPFESDPFRKRRVLVNLERVHARRVAPFWLRPVIVATLLVSGTATAALGHRYVTHGTGFFGFGARATTETPSPSAVPVHARAAAVTPAVASDAPSSSAEPVVDAPPDIADPAPSAVRPAAKGSAHARPDSSEDATHVVEAIQALRTEKDPSRAQGLLSDYLKTNPNGVLSEDAMALSIEAASAQHDPRAADYARRYLAKFPQGKYRDLANRALAKH